MSTSYHLETDSQIEVMNHTLEQYLRAFIHHRPTKWFEFLALAGWSYNITMHSATNISPFEATYGKSPPSLLQYLLGSSPVEAVDTLLTTRSQLHVELHRKLTKAQSAMKLHVDCHCHDVSILVGD